MRVAERAPFEVEVTLESEHNFYAGLTENISEGGVFIATYAPPPSGAVVDLVLTLPGAHGPFCLRGVVRWVREASASSDGAPTGCGVQWLRLPAEVHAAILSFVHARSTLLFDEDAA